MSLSIGALKFVERQPMRREIAAFDTSIVSRNDLECHRKLFAMQHLVAHLCTGQIPTGL
jgi:hypothetical protein